MDGCERIGLPPYSGRCKPHQRQYLATGKAGGTPIRRFAPGAKCVIDDCSNLAKSRGWCAKHYARFRSHGDPLAVAGRERTGIRTCFRCERVPDEVEFKKDKRAPDGLGAYCKPCAKARDAERYLANKTQINERNRQRYYANRETYLAQQHNYRLANLEVIRAKERERARGNLKNIARSRRWREENRDQFLAGMRRWYRANTARSREAGRRWRAANPERVRELAANSQAKRSAQKRNSAGRIEHINRRAVWKRDRGICGLCAQPVAFRDMHLDHFIALDKGGSHTWSNVHATHSHCNLSKGNREVPKWGFATLVVPAPRKAPPTDVLLLF